MKFIFLPFGGVVDDVVGAGLVPAPIDVVGAGLAAAPIDVVGAGTSPAPTTTTKN